MAELVELRSVLRTSIQLARLHCESFASPADENDARVKFHPLYRINMASASLQCAETIMQILDVTSSHVLRSTSSAPLLTYIFK